jgi:hypothetical protein
MSVGPVAEYIAALRRFVDVMAPWRIAEAVARPDKDRGQADHRTIHGFATVYAAQEVMEAWTAIDRQTCSIGDWANLVTAHKVFGRLLDRCGITIHEAVADSWLWNFEHPRPIPSDDPDLGHLRDLLAIVPPSSPPTIPSEPTPAAVSIKTDATEARERQPEGEQAHESTAESEPSTRNSGSRGRTRGRDKIGEAITRLIARMKEHLPTDIPSIARDVGCSPQNLRQSRKFMNAYKSLSEAFARLPRGSKQDGIVEAEDEDNS